MPRNDGIGGTPRLARYTSIGLPKRTPREDDDPRFLIHSGHIPTRPPEGSPAARSPELSRELHDANQTARTHIPNRTTGECFRCAVVAPCAPFKRAMAILDRWEPVTARRIQAVLKYSGLFPTMSDEGPEPGTAPDLCPGDLVALRQCDHVAADRPVRLRVVEVWTTPQKCSWVMITGHEVSDEPDRNGIAVTVRPYRDALAREGVVIRPDPGPVAGRSGPC